MQQKEKINCYKIGADFEAKAFVFLKSHFEKVIWLSAGGRSTYDFKCYRDGKEFNVEAKYVRNPIMKPRLRLKQKDADFVITNKLDNLILIEKKEFYMKVSISRQDFKQINLSIGTKE